MRAGQQAFARHGHRSGLSLPGCTMGTLRTPRGKDKNPLSRSSRRETEDQRGSHAAGTRRQRPSPGDLLTGCAPGPPRRAALPAAAGGRKSARGLSRTPARTRCLHRPARPPVSAASFTEAAREAAPVLQPRPREQPPDQRGRPVGAVFMGPTRLTTSSNVYIKSSAGVVTHCRQFYFLSFGTARPKFPSGESKSERLEIIHFPTIWFTLSVSEAGRS